MEFIHLTGTEDVQRAANTMGSAANVIQSAAGSIEYSLHQHRIYLDEFIQRFEAAIDKLKENHG